MTAPQMFGLWIAAGILFYVLGWLFGRRRLRRLEREAIERRLRDDPDLAFVSGTKWKGVQIRRPSAFPLELNRIPDQCQHAPDGMIASMEDVGNRQLIEISHCMRCGRPIRQEGGKGWRVDPFRPRP